MFRLMCLCAVLAVGLTAPDRRFLLMDNPFIKAWTDAATSAMNTFMQGYTNLLNGGSLTGGSSSGSNLFSGMMSGLGSLPGMSSLPGGSLPGMGGGVSAGPAGKLDSYHADATKVSVSGISAGGAMATQMHVAFSSDIMGAGIIAGLPYHCSQGQLMTALMSCMRSPGSISASNLEQFTQSAASSGGIDPVSNMQNDKVYIFDGTADTVVNPGIGRVTEAYYQHFLSSNSNIKTVFNMNAQHGQPTDNYGAACGTLASDNFINNCQYSAAYDLLNFIYSGNLQKPDSSTSANGELLRFDQNEFVGQSSSTSSSSSSSLLSGLSLPGLGGSSSSSCMDSAGYVYIPTGCKNKTTSCKVHVAFHGCKMGHQKIGETYVRHAGYNEVGELNNIIILYPQVVSSMVGNPNGCFDWWGYAGANFDQKSGVQMAAVKKMIDRLTQ